MITNEISEKYLQQMLTGYTNNLPQIQEHIRKLKAELMANEKHESEMRSAISDISAILGETIQ
tara:strand:+ start:581 stop:769 length:189 start_codon:yes stop_codon:yes gene_type:complete